MVVFFDNTRYCITLFKYPTVLILDSGVGGLSVYQDLRCLLPCIYYLYFFDNEAFPYGQRSSRFIFDRIVKIVKKVCQIHRLDLAILACNTVTVLLLEKLQRYFFFPIIGIIPDVLLGLQYTRNGIIGILATYRTIKSRFVLNVVNQFSMSYQFLLLSSADLVRIAEDKILYNKRVSISLLRDIFAPWLNVFRQPDTIILGCTHFLHLERELRIVFPKGVCLIGSSKRFACRVAWLLNRHSFLGGAHISYGLQNQAYCSMITEKVSLAWSLILCDYNFSSLEEISI